MRMLLAAASILTAAVGSQVVFAQTGNVAIAGGELDSRIGDADVYLDVPRSAAVPAGTACALAERYVRSINEGKYGEVADLFTDDAAVLEPKRLGVRGRAAIERFYTGSVAQSKVKLVAVSYLGNDTDCMVALAVAVNIGGTARYKLVSVDHFTLGAQGKATRMVAFLRP